MPIDDRKRRILMAIVSLYATGGEPVGSNLLSRHFEMAVSSATLRNEMAALTRLGLLEQPHTSAGRVPTAKGYRYYVDNLLNVPTRLSAGEREKINKIFRGLDYDPQKLVQGAARALSDLLKLAVVATTPRADDMRIAHFEILQVGRYSAAVLAVTQEGGVMTRVAKTDFEFTENDAAELAETLNSHLRFVAEADVDSARIRSMMDSLGPKGPRSWPVLSAALTLLAETGKPHVFYEGQMHLLQWPELEGGLRNWMELLGDAERLEELLHPRSPYTEVLFGDEFPYKPLPGFCMVSKQYVAGGGLSGAIVVAGPTRMPYREVIPRLVYFNELLGKCMGASGSAV